MRRLTNRLRSITLCVSALLVGLFVNWSISLTTANSLSIVESKNSNHLNFENNSAYTLDTCLTNQSLVCIGSVNVTLAADCTAEFQIADFLLDRTIPDSILFIEIKDANGIIKPQTGSGTVMFMGSDGGNQFTVSVGYKGCTSFVCWTEVTVVRELIPNINSNCIYIPPQLASFSQEVRNSNFVTLDENGDIDEILNKDTLQIGNISVDTSCQTLTLNITSDVRHFSVEHSTETADWKYDTIFWNLLLTNTSGTVSTGSGTFTNNGLKNFSPNTTQKGSYALEVAVKAADNNPGFITTGGPDGVITARFESAECLPLNCETWCPSETPPAAILTTKEIQAELDSKPCYVDFLVSEQKIITGNVCGDGRLVVITHSATVVLPNGETEKRVVLRQAYKITQPTTGSLFVNVGTCATMGSSFAACNTEVSCGDDISPLGIYKKLMKDAAANFTTYDSAVLHDIRVANARKSFPFILSVHETGEETFSFPDVTDHKLVSSEGIFKVLRYFNQITSSYVDSTFCATNTTTCMPVWVKESYVDKVVKEITIPGGDTTLNVIPIEPLAGDNVCGYNAKYDDVEFPSCGGGRKIRRSWSVFDWCAGRVLNNSARTQTIIVKDDVPPVVVAPIRDMTLSIEPWTCVRTFEIDEEGIAIDKCLSLGQNGTDGITYQWTAPGAGVVANRVTVWLGETITVTGTISDQCGNYTTTKFDVTIIDAVPPVAIANDQINVVLTGSDDVGTAAKINVESIDAGSHDAGCNELQKCLIREEDYEAGRLVLPGRTYVSVDGKTFAWREPPIEYVTPDGQEAFISANNCSFKSIKEYYHDKFGQIIDTKIYTYVTCSEEIKICCEDLGDVSVIMKIDDGQGNIGYTWTIAHIEDKSGLGWSCTAADALCTDIDYFEPPLPTFGGVLCPMYSVKEVKREFSIKCGDGTIDITWMAVDVDGNEVSTDICSYPVRRPAGYNFDPKTIKWPKHYDSKEVTGINKECLGNSIDIRGKDNIAMGPELDCSIDQVMSEPAWCLSNCDLILSSFEDFQAPNDATCGKVIRRWTIIDWCTWQPNNNASIDDANDSTDDIFTAVEDWTLNDVCNKCDNYSGDVGNVYFEYVDVDIDGYYTFDQILKLDDSDPPNIIAEQVVISTEGGNTTKDNPDFSECKATGVATIVVIDDCNGISSMGGLTIRWTFNGEEGFGNEVSLIDLPGGRYSIQWSAQDACGNISEAVQHVLIQDLKLPTPVCRQDVSTATMNTDGTATIWASDFDLGSFDNCSIPIVYFKDDEGNHVPSLTFDCSDLVGGVRATIDLRMYAGDDQDNEDFCNVKLRIDDSTDNCPDLNQGATASISGSVHNARGDMIESAEIALDLIDYSKTGVDGAYAFNSNPMYLNYEVSSSKNDDHLNGVSSLDLVLIQRHILGIKLIDDPYGIIAGDVNSDERISAVDIVELRKLILGLSEEFQNNDSWRFVDANQTFKNPVIPFPFIEKLRVDNLDQNVFDQNFIGVKIGDVNGNAIANSLIGTGGRSSYNAGLYTIDKAIAINQLISVPIGVKDISNINALQFTMNLNGVELVDIEPISLEVSMDNVAQLSSEDVTFVWHSDHPIDVSDDLFNLVFSVQKDQWISEALTISSGITPALAYDNLNNEYSVSWSFNQNNIEENSPNFLLAQNTPNPFSQETIISFTLTDEARAILTVFDVSGKMLKSFDGQYKKGGNQITIDKDDLSGPGLYYYQLESENWVATKKMIVVAD